ncbi:hypothetical protein P5705_01955 [Pseudomonas entomophila]|uniref:hypothetical protein n=1 Tax=Pseudomonas entomophila TaxID=312306 RepID=UPI002404A2FA|nr:hypothetical protein [Pseudomonas entomophila]MDF9616396.1 hypothetical protein [Pseudomonas entomophila]
MSLAKLESPCWHKVRRRLRGNPLYVAAESFGGIGGATKYIDHLNECNVMKCG